MTQNDTDVTASDLTGQHMNFITITYLQNFSLVLNTLVKPLALGLNNNHEFDFQNSKIDTKQDWKKRLISEMIFINHDPNSINMEENTTA